jgi:glycosyltransferase involved in cell wall biosynthesis
MNLTLPSALVPSAPLDLRIAFLTTYPPRRCGIGTYSKDLITSINNLNPDRLVEVIAMDDAISETLDYPWEVSRRIRQNVWEDYEKVLDYINNSIIDVVCIQHEYGIYGDNDGQYVVDFVKKLKKPFIVTFHTILEHPRDSQLRIIQELSELSSGIVVMLSVAGDILQEVYGIAPEKIVAIHHGTPDFPYRENGEKKLFGLEDNIVMSSVNLISEGKGIEYAIQALPEVVRKYPNFVYLIVGQTHPVILKREGEVYREKLEGLVKEFGLENNVRFVNEYVPLEDLIKYVMASDFYITPYENLEQISSGALAYAIAAGKLCVSTPYRYAQEMLAGGRGFLVEPKNPEAIAKAILKGIAKKDQSERMRLKCYSQGRRMIWARVGFRHLRILENLLALRRKSSVYAKPTLSYVRALTDSVGMLEHATHEGHNIDEGYSVDDNARALIVAIQYGDKKLADLYLDYISRSELNGLVYCDMDGDAKLIGTPGTGDWFGRTFWAVAYAMHYGQTLALRKRATEIMRRMIMKAPEADSLRTIAFILLGLVCLKELEWDELVAERDALLNQAIGFIRSEFSKHSDPSWIWPASDIAYDNPRIPMALLEVAQAYNDPELREFGLDLLNFLLDHTFDVLENHFRFIGNNGWYKKGGIKAHADEQPIEAGSTVQACYAAFRASGHSYYRDMAKKAFAWYHGDNILRRPMFNIARNSVYDGLNELGVNSNQGAESSLEYLLAYTCYAKLVEEGIATRDITYSTPSNRTVTQAA